MFFYKELYSLLGLYVESMTRIGPMVPKKSVTTKRNLVQYIFGFHMTKISPLWSSGQSSWLQIQRSLVRFPLLPDFLKSSGSGTGSTQPRDYN
jgi:hypothetical protein